MNLMLQFLAGTDSKHLVSVVKVEYLLKAQESRLKTFIDEADNRTYDRLETQAHTFNNDISMLRNISKERHKLFEKKPVEMKVFLEN